MRILGNNVDSKLVDPINRSAQSLTNVTINGTNPINDDRQLLINAIVAGAGLVSLFIGLRTYQQSQILKKKDILKDILIPLMQEFDSQKFKVAKDILDDVIIRRSQSTDYPDGIYAKNKLDRILRDHNQAPVILEPETEIREAFDAFLDFLVKLEYLFTIAILNKNEISYFQYFIDKAATNPNVINYIKIYNFPLTGKLHPSLSSDKS